MAPTRGKRLAILSAGVAFLILIAAVYAGKDRIREEWYLRKLESWNEEDQRLAAERLGELKSARAVKPLILRLQASRWAHRVQGDDLDRLLKELDAPAYDPFATALARIGRPATLETLNALSASVAEAP